MAIDENNGTPAPGGADSRGLVDIAAGAAATAEQAPRKRGRPAGSKSAGAAEPAIPAAPLAAPVPLIVWNEKNVGAITRLAFSVPAMLTDIKEMALTAPEQEAIVPAAVEVMNQFAPMAAAKWASVITLSAALIAVGSNKWQIYRAVQKTKEIEADNARKTRGATPQEEKK